MEIKVKAKLQLYHTEIFFPEPSQSCQPDALPSLICATFLFGSNYGLLTSYSKMYREVLLC